MATQQTQDNTTALVLSGGGAKGAFQAGALEVLREAGYTFDAISGVSVGSLNGAMLASNQFTRLLEIWREISPSKVLQKHSLLSLARQYLTYKIGISDPPVSRFNNKPLRQLMERYLLGKSIQKPFHFGYVKLESGAYIQATIHSKDQKINKADLDRLLASSAIPVYFNPVDIEGSTAVDGGLRNITPIKSVVPCEPDRMILIPTEPFGMDPETTQVRDILEIAFRSIDIMLDEIFKEDIDRFLAINRLVKQAESENLTLTKSDGSPYKYIEPLLIDPQKPLGDPLDFENQRIQKLLDYGRQRAQEVLDEMESPLA